MDKEDKKKTRNSLDIIGKLILLSATFLIPTLSIHKHYGFDIAGAYFFTMLLLYVVIDGLHSKLDKIMDKLDIE